MDAIPEIETIIFDCGRVLTLDQDEEKASEMAGLLGASLSSFLRVYTGERLEYDKGVIAADEYWTRVAAGLNAPLSEELIPRLVRLDMESWFTINSGVVGLVKELKSQGYRLLMLSNMNLEGKEMIFGRARICGNTDWVEYFDEILLSCDLGELKPDKAIYDKCLARTAAPAERCLFIDDMPINVESARKNGIRALLFKDLPSLRSDLEMEYSILTGTLRDLEEAPPKASTASAGGIGK